jgi:hypothetical protein
MSYLDAKTFDPRLIRTGPATSGKGSESRGMLRGMGDLAAGFSQGAVQGVRMLTDLAGADNSVSTGLRSVEDFIGGLKSAQAKQDEQEIARILEEAEGAGVLEQVVAGVRAFATAPGVTTAQALGSAAPTIAASLIPGVGQAAAAGRLGMLASRFAPAAVGAAQGVGTVKGSIFDEVKQTYLEAGYDEATAIERATEQQSYGGQSAGQLVLGGVAGAVAGGSGLERATQALRFGTAAKPSGMLRRMSAGGVTEFGTEGFQGGQEKFASNSAVANEGFERDPWAGVVAAGTLEATAGGVLGAGFGIPKPSQVEAAPDLRKSPDATPTPAEVAARVLAQPTVEAAVEEAGKVLSSKPPGGSVPAGDQTPFGDRVLTLREQLADPAVRETIRTNLGDQALSEVTYYAGVADRADTQLPEKTRERMLALAEGIVQRATFQPLPVQPGIGSDVGAPGLALPAPAAGPGMLRLPPPAGQSVLMADAQGNVAAQPAEARTEALNRDFTARQEADAQAQRRQALGKQTPRGQEPPARPGTVPVGEATEVELIPTGDVMDWEYVPTGRATELPVETIQADDLLTGDGMPYGSLTAARMRAKKVGLPLTNVVEIPGSGWVIRPNMVSQRAPDAMGLVDGRPAGTRPTAAADLAASIPPSGRNQRNEVTKTDAPTAAATQAASAEAPAAAVPDAAPAAPAGVPGAGAAEVEAGGVTTDAAAPATSSTDAEPYTVPVRPGDDWQRSKLADFEPTPRQKRVMDVVARALDDGLFYNNDVTERAAKELGATAEQRSVGVDRVQGGDFGMDVYYARQAVEAIRRREAEKRAKDAANFQAGEKLGTLIFNDGKQVRAAVIEKVEGDVITFSGKRGSQVVRGNASAMQLKSGMDRAKERGARAYGFDDYAKAKQPAPAPEAQPTAQAVDRVAAAPAPKVFKSRAGAEAAKTGNTQRIKKVKGGYILRDATDKEMAAAAKAGQRLARGAPVDVENDSLLTAISKLGGIAMSERADTIGSGNRNIAGKMLFREGGMPIDRLADEALQEYGYIPAEFRGDPSSWLRDAIAAEFMGTRSHYSDQGTEWMQEEDPTAGLGDDELAEFSGADLEQSGYSTASPEVKALTEKLLAEAELAGIDTEAIREDAARLTEGQLADEYETAVQEAIRQAIAQTRQDAGRGDASAAQGGGSRDGEAAGDPGQDEGLTLEAQTPEDLRAKARREEDAAKAEKKAKAAEQERLRKEAEDREINDRARQDASAENFQLGQDAGDALAGQGGLFDAAPSPAPAAPKTLVDRATRSDGRSVPVEGDDVYMEAAGAFGMPASVRGTVARGKNGLFVRITDSGGMMGERVKQKTADLTSDWTLIGEESGASRRRRASAEKLQAESDKRRAEYEADRVEAAARNGTLDPSKVKLGDVVERPDGTLAIVGERDEQGGIYLRTLDDTSDSPRGIGNDLRGFKLRPDVKVPADGTQVIRRDRQDQALFADGWQDVKWNEDAERYERITPESATPPALPREQGEAEPAASQPAGPAKVDNFGQALPPARRNMAAKLTEDLTNDDIANRTLSEIWPLAENDAIEDQFAAAVAHAARAEIPAKPRVAYKLRAWVVKVKTLREMAGKIVSGQWTKDRMAEKIANEFTSLRDWWSKVTLLEQIDRAQWKRIGSVEERPQALTYEGGKEVPSPMLRIEVDGKSKWLTGDAGVEGEARGTIAGNRAGVAALLETAKPEQRMEFEIRGTASFKINKKGDPEYRPLMTFATPAEARKAINEQYDSLVAAWEAVKARDNITERDLRSPENRPRVGKDHRNGKDVTAEQFQAAFGFKGGEFGKWVQQGKGDKERQALLNSSYDALMDLADIIGLPPRALSLNGTLGIAFGSRGSGWASAHFEPSNLVINLTKTRGAGTLAHEWLHAADNYFARMRRDGQEAPFTGDQSTYRNENYITHRPEPLMIRKDRSRAYPTMTLGQLQARREFRKSKGLAGFPPPDAYDADKWERDPSTPEGVRPEVEARFADLVKALAESPMAKRAALLDKSNSGYWTRTLEMAARAFESYVIAKMHEQGYHNDFLVNVKKLDETGKSDARYPYLLAGEVKPIADAFDALFETIQTRADEAGNVAMYEPAPGDYTASYETDIFGDPLPEAPPRPAGARSAGARVRRNAQPESAVLGDTPAPAGNYLVRTTVGTTTTRQLGAKVIKTAADAAAATRYLYRSAVERLDGIVTDKNGKPLAVIGGFKGTLNQASVYPFTMVTEAVRIPGAANIWISHNHPSGKANLSRGDEMLNRTLAGVFAGSGIEVQGTLAIGASKFGFVDGAGDNIGTLDDIPAAQPGVSVPVVERELVEDGAERTVIDSPQKGKDAAYAHYKAAGNKPGILLLNSQYGVTGWVPLDGTPMMGRLKNTGGLNAIYRAISESNAGAAILVHGGELDAGVMGPSVTIAQNIGAALSAIQVTPLDIVNVTAQQSVAEQGGALTSPVVFSRGSATGTSPEALRSTLEAEFGAGVVAALERAGLLNIEQTPRAGMPSDVAGATTRDGSIALFGDNTAPGSAAVAYHEALHATLRATIGDAAYDALMARLGRLQARAAADGPINRFFAEAVARIPADTPGAERAEELAAYAVEQYQLDREKMPSVVRRWVEDFMAAIRAGLAKALRSLGVGVGAQARLLASPAVLRKLARDGMRTMARQQQREMALAFSRDAEIPPFYSALTRAVDGAGMNAAPAGGWKQAIKGWISAGKVKADEVEWSGLNEWLDLQTGKVTRDAVGDFLRANGVRVTETVLGEPDGTAEFRAQLESMSDEELEAEADNEGIEDIGFMSRGQMIQAIMATYDQDMPSQTERGSGDTKYAQYQLPGGTNYREVLLTLPTGGPSTINAMSDAELRALILRNDGNADVDGVSRADLLAMVSGMEMSSADLAKLTGKNAAQYKSGHWDQPNVLAHIRLNDRVDASGARVLFVEEIQSDWAQAGAKKTGRKLDDGSDERVGFRRPFTGRVPTVKGEQITLREFLDREGADGQDWLDRQNAVRADLNDPPLTDTDPVQVIYEDGKMARATSRIRGTVQQWADQIARGWQRIRDTERQQWVAKQADKPPMAPFVEATDKWVALALKRVIKMAVDEGYDKVAFVNGEQSADRYDLSRQIKEIQYEKRPTEESGGEAQYRLGITTVTGSDVPDKGWMNLADIEAFVGKDIAKKIEAGEGKRYRGRDGPTLEGLDLKVGGEGMKTFYDKIVPSVTKDVLRRVGGSGMETVSLTSEQNAVSAAGRSNVRIVRNGAGNFVLVGPDGERVDMQTFPTRQEAEAARMESASRPETLTQPGFTITPAMREKAAAGLPLFSRRADQTQTPMSAANVQALATSLKVRLDLNESPKRIDLMLIERREGSEPGSGRKVLEALVQYADASKKTIYLDVKGNAGQLGEVYYSLGFEEVDRVPGRPDWEAGMRRKPRASDVRFSRAAPPANTGQSLEGAMQQDGVARTAQSFLDQPHAKLTKGDWWRRASSTLRGSMLGAMTRDQIADVWGREIPQVAEYDRLTRSMENERQSIAQQADAIYQRWAKIKGEDNDRLARIMLDATVNQIHPEPGGADVPQNRATAEQQAMQRRLRAMFLTLNPKAQEMYREVRDFHTATLTKLREALEDRIERTLESGSDRQAIIEDVRKRFDAYMAGGPYFPLSRFGDYLVIGTREDGERVVSAYENSGEQAAAARALEADGFTVKLRLARQYNRATDGAAGKFIGDMIAAIAKVDMREATVNGTPAELKAKLLDDLNQLYIRALPDLSYRKHFLHRKNTPGFSADVMRGFASSAFHAAGHIARINHGDKMTGELEEAFKAVDDLPEGDATEAGQVLEELNKRHDVMLNPDASPVSTMLTSAGFLLYLGMSPAAGVINLLQVPMVTIPYLGAKYGFGAAAAAYTRAMNDIRKAPPNLQSLFNAADSPALSAAEVAMVRALQDEGMIDVTQAHDLAGATVQDTGNQAQTRASFAIARAMRIVGWTFHVPEVMNRQATALMAFRLASSRGASAAQAADAAREAIKRTQFDYSASNTARYMQGNLMRVVTQFKKFSQNMTYFLVRAAVLALKDESPEVRRIARRQLASTFAVTGMMAGTLGMPVIGVIGSMVQAIVNGLGDDDDEPWDWKVAYRNLWADAVGADAAEVIAKGVPRALMPWDIADRVSLNDLWWRGVDTAGANPREAWAANTAQLLGPVLGGYSLAMFTAADQMSRGNYAKGIEAMVPKFIRDPLKAYREGIDGVTTYTGEPLTDVSGVEVMGRAMGFGPARVSEMYAGRNAVKNVQTRMEEQRRVLLTQVAQARLDRDNERAGELRDRIRQWNTKNPEFKISDVSIARAILNRRRNRDATEDGVLLPRGKESLRELGRFANVQ